MTPNKNIPVSLFKRSISLPQNFLDIFLVLVLFVVAVVAIPTAPGSEAGFRDRDMLGVGIVLLTILPLAYRSRLPFIAYIICQIAFQAHNILDYGPLQIIFFVSLVATYSAAFFARNTWQSFFVPLISISGVFLFFATTDRSYPFSEIVNAHFQWAAAWILGLSNRAFQRYHARMGELATVKERNRLARDLHDFITQSVYSLTLFAEAARHMAEDLGHEAIEKQVGQIGTVSQQVLKEMRLLVYELQPPELEKAGLIRTLRQRLEAVEGRAGVEARIVSDDVINLPRRVERQFYFIAQEALNNSLKHASATSVTVNLRAENDQVELEIVDDGVGFEPDALGSHGGMGLKSIRERAEQLGGTATFQSTKGKRTSIMVALNLKENANE